MLAHAASKLNGPARRVGGGASITLGASTVTVFDAPGHTPDSLALLVEGHLFTGDALFVGGAGRTDFVGRPESTMGAEKAENTLLRERDRATLVARMASKTAPPANMPAILRHNLGEADAATITPAELQALIGDMGWRP